PRSSASSSPGVGATSSRRPRSMSAVTTDSPLELSDQALAAFVAAGASRVATAGDLAELDAASFELVGKRSPLSSWKRQLSGLDGAERRLLGKALTGARDGLERAVPTRRDELARSARAAGLEADRLDLTEVLASPGPGHLHLVTQVRSELEDIFLGM